MKIRPNDIVRHEPTGETWVVAGVHYDGGTLIPKGYPFPSIAQTEDCTLLEERYLAEPQSLHVIDQLRRHGLESYVDVRSAMLYDVI